MCCSLNSRIPSRRTFFFLPFSLHSFVVYIMSQIFAALSGTNKKYVYALLPRLYKSPGFWFLVFIFSYHCTVVSWYCVFLFLMLITFALLMFSSAPHLFCFLFFLFFVNFGLFSVLKVFPICLTIWLHFIFIKSKAPNIHLGLMFGANQLVGFTIR